MPLVRIAFIKGTPQGFGRKAGDIVHRAMVDTISVPAADRFQIITDHGRDGLIYDPEYLGIHRTDGIVVIQITLSEGRSVELKKALYRQIAESLHAELGVRPQDVFISLVEAKKENWSFGDGIAQYAQ